MPLITHKDAGKTEEYNRDALRRFCLGGAPTGEAQVSNFERSSPVRLQCFESRGGTGSFSYESELRIWPLGRWMIRSVRWF